MKIKIIIVPKVAVSNYPRKIHISQPDLKKMYIIFQWHFQIKFLHVFLASNHTRISNNVYFNGIFKVNFCMYFLLPPTLTFPKMLFQWLFQNKFLYVFFCFHPHLYFPKIVYFNCTLKLYFLVRISFFHPVLFKILHTFHASWYRNSKIKNNRIPYDTLLPSCLTF